MNANDWMVAFLIGVSGVALGIVLGTYVQIRRCERGGHR